MTRQEIESRIKLIISAQLGVGEDEINARSSFMHDLGAESLDIVELVMAFEEEFGIEIPDKEAAKILTMGDAVNYLETHLVG